MVQTESTEHGFDVGGYSLIYVTDVIDRVLYSYIYVLLATAGLICFLAFWFTFVLFRNVVCNRKHSKVQEERQDLVP